MKSEQLKQHIVTIGVDQSLSNSAMYEHRYLENICKLYKISGKCDNQQQYKTILEASMVSTPEGFIENSPMSPSPSITVKQCAMKALRQFLEALDVKHKTDVLRLGAAK